jgi:hypothetical protein
MQQQNVPVVQFISVLLEKCYSGGKIQDTEMGKACSRHLGGERRGVCRVFVKKPYGKRPLGRPKVRWEDNIKIVYKKMRCVGMDWIDSAQGRDR